MADEMDRIAHPDPEAIHAPSVPTARARRPRRRRRWLTVLALALTLMQLMPNLGLLSPVLSPLIYSNLAPPTWHNATPHGTLVLSDFAASMDDPGLALACASLFTLAWPEPWALGSMRYWRSVDGGSHWQLVEPPFGGQQDCDLALPLGGNGTVLAAVSSSYESAPATLWVSHDAGSTWRQVATAPAGDAAESLHTGIHFVVYRNGLMYGSTEFGSSAGGGAFAVSGNDGATWTALERSPDRLEQQGWQVAMVVPDYRSTGWWYRGLSLTGSIPLLEHSQDNGATWSVVGPIGTSPLAGLALATMLLLPGHLCAGVISPQTSQITLLASADGGRTWRKGTIPNALQRAQGETSLTIGMGATGDCYEGYHYGLGREPTEGNSHFGFLRLASDSTVLDYIPLTDDGNSLALTFAYVPAGNGMPARLVAELNGTYPGWASLFSGLAAETTADGQIVWHTVP
ncbi:MAG TPA: sialidase family protein [Ktedonobacterales bacterium]